MHRLRQLVDPERALVQLLFEHAIELAPPARLGAFVHRSRRIGALALEREPTPQPLCLGQEAIDAREQLARVEGLVEVVVRARGQPDDRVLAAGLGGEQQHRDRVGLGIRAQAPRQLDAIEARHHHVAHDHVGQELARQPPRARAVPRLRHLVLRLEQLLEPVADVVVVVHDQHERACAPHSGFPASQCLGVHVRRG